MSLGRPDGQPEPDGLRGPTPVPPLKVVEALRPRAGQRFLDIACGAGDFFFPVFEAMAGQGVFLAAEWDEERLRRFLTRLESYAEHPGYTRIEVLRARPDRLPLPDRCVDLVLMAHGYNRMGERSNCLRELRRVLAPGGTLCLVDGAPPAAGAAARRGAVVESASEHVACRELESAGFQWMVVHTGFPQHWCLTVRV